MSLPIDSTEIQDLYSFL